MTNYATPGRRIASPFDDHGELYRAWPEAGDYWYDINVGWCAVTPNAHHIRFTALGCKVVEHEDHTITVPLIEFANWTGRITGGVWEET